ncbi:MAG: NAD(P)/FAD-dependent oxidoreductase [Myxococcales bacterium]|nr:NAD(P)/FAD-dependent oxidoreductase [Myxococcales bacterium]
MDLQASTETSERPGPTAASEQVPHHRIAILGAGFGGLGMAIRLLQTGENDFVVLEKADDVGGAWRDNTYPGCQCDVASTIYSYSFAQNPNWTRTFAWQGEILQYLRDCADNFGVRPYIRFGHEVEQARWDEAAQRWRLQTSAGRFSADILVLGQGGLSAPSMPDIPGLDNFEGAVFHSANWDHDHDLSGERVAVVGTGASAIQVIPAIQPRVGEMKVFQRTPAYVVPRIDHEFSDTKKSLFKRVPFLQKLDRFREYATREFVVMGMVRPKMMKRAGKRVLQHMRDQVKDRELRKKLTPNYTLGCKRILISNDYYPALDQPNVDVITDSIDRVTANSIVTKDGQRYDVDTIIMCTGFKVTNHPVMEMVFGSDGRSIGEHWKEGAAAYLGTTIAGFPNLFLLSGPYTGLGHNSMIYMLESQFEYILGALSALQQRQAATLQVRAEAAMAFDQEMQDKLEGTVWTSGCASWYLDENGRNTTVWPDFSFRFRNRTRKFDAMNYDFETRAAGRDEGEQSAGVSEPPAQARDQARDVA